MDAQDVIVWLKSRKQVLEKQLEKEFSDNFDKERRQALLEGMELAIQLAETFTDSRQSVDPKLMEKLFN